MDRDPVSVGEQNLAFVEELYQRFIENPAAVGADWRAYFEALDASALAPVNGRSAANGNGSVGADLTGAPEQLGAASAVRPRALALPSGSSASRPAASAASALASVDLLELTPELSERIPFLESLTIFRGVPREELGLVARLADVVRFNDGDLVFRQNEDGNDLYVVMDGTVMIRRHGKLVAVLGRGEVAGELTVIDHLPRAADAVARGEVRCLRINGDDLLKLVDTRPVFARGLIRVLTRRARETGARQDLIDQLIRAYRVRGHLHADINPLKPPARNYPELDPAYYGFTPEDLDSLFSSATIPGAPTMTLRDILALLNNTYCRSIGVQFMHIDDLEVKDWLQERMESSQNQRGLSREEQLRILTKLTDAEIFEQFMHAKFVGAKRFSLEGAESLIPLLDMAIEEAGEKNIKEIVVGMAHRGRLNVLANIMGKSPRQIFREFDDAYKASNRGAGDVKYHLGHSRDYGTASGKAIHLSLCFNPSHLEFVGPVVLGRTRAKQDRYADTDKRKGMGIIIHGDAAFSGQGVVQEMLNMSELEGYTTGGTLHIVLNNQIGFTTDPREGRSMHYATDVARMLQIPIFHVNGEHPEPVAQVIKLAMDFREQFKKDVVIDMYCYRRHGHNEGDEPAFTQPLLYETIRKRKSVREAYLENLLKLGGITREEADQIAIKRRQALEHDLGQARSPDYPQTGEISFGLGVWRPYRGGPDKEVAEVPTGVPREKLAQLLLKQAVVPDDFHPHSKITKLLRQREAMARGDQALDWAAGEALAFASLLVEQTRIRLSGQDAGRGTFSHRHAVLHDVKDGKTYTPLQNLALGQGKFQVYNSPLTEIAVLGFDYGFSLDMPDALTIWEAQFGDFANVAQVILDQFISSSEDKWNRLSSLVMLLPHGFEGGGPEHSSARLERYLQLTAEDNIQVANLTTPAQLFHCLRRQIHRPIRKPLVIMSPKSLLRHPEAISTLDDLANGRFQRLIPDVGPRDPSRVRRVLLTSGKIYYELAQMRAQRNTAEVAILRLEQYYPLDQDMLRSALSIYPRNAEHVWVQEEPLNMGAWGYLHGTLSDTLFRERPFSCIARPASASPATGSHAAHQREQAELIEAAFAGVGPAQTVAGASVAGVRGKEN